MEVRIYVKFRVSSYEFRVFWEIKMGEIKKFEDMEAWKKSRKLTMDIYSITKIKGSKFK